MKQKVQRGLDPEEEYLDRLKKVERRKRNALVAVAILSVVALVGMIIFWK